MLSGAAARYGDFLRRPDVARMLALALVSRMPIGMLSLAMLMHVRTLSASFTTAGITLGVFLAAAGTTAPVIGRIVDRVGPRVPLIVTSVVYSTALGVLIVAGPLQVSAPAMVVLAGVAGAFAPPITVLTRTMWRYRFDDERDRRTAFSLDAVLIELAFTIGPALIAALLAFGSAMLAYAVAWCFCAASVPLFLVSPALKYWRHEPDAKRGLLGPLSNARLLNVYASTFLFTFSLGMLEVGYPGFATAAAWPALAGILLAINSGGSAIGGFAYGAMHVAPNYERTVPILLAVMAVPIALHAATTSPWLLATLALAAGFLIAPVMTMFTMLITANAPSRYATEAFTWSTTCIVGGLGAGYALGGRVVEGSGAAAAFGCSAGIALAAAASALGLHQIARRSKQPRDADGR